MNDFVRHLLNIAFIMIVLGVYGKLLESHHKASQRSRLIEAIIKNLERRNSSEQRDNNTSQQIYAKMVPNPINGCNSQ